jgi:hypothetical protein
LWKYFVDKPGVNGRKVDMTSKLRSILFLLGYGLLTVIKLFTGVVVGLGDPTTSLVIKAVPTIRNFWSMGEETAANIAKHTGTWYFEKKYWLLTANENGFIGETFYNLLILCWWVITLTMVVKVFRKRQFI